VREVPGAVADTRETCSLMEMPRRIIQLLWGSAACFSTAERLPQAIQQGPAHENFWTLQTHASINSYSCFVRYFEVTPTRLLRCVAFSPLDRTMCPKQKTTGD